MVLYNGEKMSKSRGNVIGIDETAERFGVDAMRLLLLYVTPPEDTSDWTDEGIIGRVRMLNRLWRACEPHFAHAKATPLRELPVCTDGAEKALVRAVHVAAKSSLDETLSRRFHYNTTIAKFDEYLNALTTVGKDHPGSAAVRYAVHALPVLIAPFAPHVADELWSRMGYTKSVHTERYLEVDDRALELDEMTLVVQVNGKLRARIALPSGTDEATAVAAALANAAVQQHIEGKEIRKQIYVPGKLLNIVV